jgi:predicted enzyme related to lactoylglutathione lyase
MPAAIEAGAVLFTKNVTRIGAFYAAVAGMRETQRGRGFVVLERAGFQLVMHGIAKPIAAQIAISDPPRRRQEAPIKLVFVVPDIDAARAIVAERGGEMDPPDREWNIRAWRACDGHDPEGNVFQLRELVDEGDSR